MVEDHKLNKKIQQNPIINYWILLNFITKEIEFEFSPPSQANPSINESITEHIFLMLIIAPFLETLLFQKVLVFILQITPFISERNILIILISSTIFGLSHQFDITYIIAATLMGIVFNYSYSIYQEKNYNDPQSMSAFWIVFWIHELHYAIAFLIIEFGQKL